MTPQPPEKGIKFTERVKRSRGARWMLVRPTAEGQLPVHYPEIPSDAGEMKIMTLTTPNFTALQRAPGLAAFAAFVALSAPVAALAQNAAPANAPAASAPEVPPPLKPSPLVTSPSDAQRTLDSNNEPAGGKVMPQLRIPLGKKAGPVVFERHRSPSGAASAPARLVDDSAARCESETDKQLRSHCRSQLVHQ